MLNNFHNFDPYDALVELNQHLLELKAAHNNLARAFDLQTRDLNLALDSLSNLQKAHLTLAQSVQALGAAAMFQQELTNKLRDKP
jgi:hypothetical protein